MLTCKTCKFRDAETKICLHPNIGELPEQSEGKKDFLAYSYNEGGVMEAGEDFGCIHHSEG